MQEKDYYVYVQAPDGTPLMPTRRFGWVRRTLKKGMVCVVTVRPFTIRLTYEPKTRITQPIILGIDPGRTNIGLAAVTDDGTCLYAAECETRNKEIPKLMTERRIHRQASRRGERLARKRLAKAHGTIMKTGQIERILPGCKKAVVVKDIINTEARFNNRKRQEGWLTPTARQLLLTHLNLIRKVQKILPVSRVCLEVNRFAFMKLEAGGKLKDHKAYQTGPMYGFHDDKKALNAQQGGKCLLCGKKPIEAVHHIRPRHAGGSDTLANKAGLCEACHDRVHKDAEAAQKLADKKDGIIKKYGALSVLNQIIPRLVEEISTMMDGQLFLTTGWKTKETRDAMGIDKEHYLDAYCIAISAISDDKAEDRAKAPGSCYNIWQFRRKDRQLIKAQKERAYYLDGKLIAKNRKKRKEQKDDSLADWYARFKKEYGDQEAEAALSRLAVKKSARSYNNPKRSLPGFIVRYKGNRLLITGQRTNGQYYLSPDIPGVNIPARDAVILTKNTGLVYASKKRR